MPKAETEVAGQSLLRRFGWQSRQLALDGGQGCGLHALIGAVAATCRPALVNLIQHRR